MTDLVPPGICSEFKRDASPICVSLRAPRAGGFRAILSHLPQRPAAALLSHAGAGGESVHRALNDKWGSSSRACLLGAKEGDRALDRVVTLLGGSVSHFLPCGIGCVKLQTLTGFLSWRGLMEVCSEF